MTGQSRCINRISQNQQLGLSGFVYVPLRSRQIDLTVQLEYARDLVYAAKDRFGSYRSLHASYSGNVHS